MATYNKFNQFVEDVNHGVHALNNDQLVVALTNSAPVATNTILANITQVAYTFSSTRDITTSASGQTSGTYKLTLTDLTLTATGGAIGPFRYVVIYNSTPITPVNPLIAWFDYGSSITVADGETFLIDFSDANGLFTES